jgi:hypothetical protein
MSEIALRDTDNWTHVLPAVGDLAAKIAQTEFVPDAMRGKPAVVAACVLYGRELGLGPMTSLRSVTLIKGRPALSAEAMRAMVLAAGHDIHFDEMTSARCVITGRRKGQDASTTVTFTMDDAKKMGVGGGQQYAKMPRQMLAARATAELCRLIFADVIGGLQVDVEVDDDREALTTVAPPATTARRKKATPTSPEAAPVNPPAPPEPDAEPVLDDDIAEAEIVEEPADDTSEAINLLKEQLGATVTAEKPSGAARVRAALKSAGDPDAAPPPAPVTPSQLKGLQAGFKECGITERDERLRIARALADVDELASASDLTHHQADSVLQGLAFAKSTPNPAATLREASA